MALDAKHANREHTQTQRISSRRAPIALLTVICTHLCLDRHGVTHAALMEFQTDEAAHA